MSASPATDTPAKPATPATPADISAMTMPPTRNGGFLSALDIAARAMKPRTVTVEIPAEFGGGSALIRALRQAEREELDDEALIRDYKDDGTMSVKLKTRGQKSKALALGLVNADMSQVYGDPEEGAKALAQLDDGLFDVLFDAFDKLNIFTAKARAELGKDSEQTRSPNSSSTLPTSGDAPRKS